MWERKTGSDLKKRRKKASNDEKKMYTKSEPSDTFSESNYLV